MARTSIEHADRRQHVTSARSLALLLAMSIVAGCGVDSGPTRLAAPESADPAKSGGAGPTVSSTNPAYAHRDTTLDVHVFGNGFSSGAKATWSLGGDTTLVHVNRTTYVSQGELIANITVPANSPLALYDVAVTLTTGKKGVGSELFEVTTAEPLLQTGRVTDSNDLGQMVGGAQDGFYYDDSCGAMFLGVPTIWGLDPLGTVLGGHDLIMWVRTGACTWSSEVLPNPGGGGGIAKSIARTPAGTVIVGGIENLTKPKNTVIWRPAVWTRSGTSWLAPTIYSTAQGQGEIWRINGMGMAVGRGQNPAGTTVGYLWNSPTDYTMIDGLPFGINDAGTIAVGHNDAGNDVYWTRHPSTGRWDPIGHVLPGVGGPGIGTAFDVNDAGIIVGRLTIQTKNIGTYWRLDLSVYPAVVIGDVQLLPGLGPTGSSQDHSSGKSITNAPVDGYYVIFGNASGPGKAYGVRWRIFP